MYMSGTMNVPRPLSERCDCHQLWPEKGIGVIDLGSPRTLLTQMAVPDESASSACRNDTVLIRVIGRYALSGRVWLDQEVDKKFNLSSLQALARVETRLPSSDFKLILDTDILDSPDAFDVWKARLSKADVVEVSLIQLGDLEESDDELAAEFEECLSSNGAESVDLWTSAGRSKRCCRSLLGRIASMATDHSRHTRCVDLDSAEDYYGCYAAPHISSQLLRDREFVLDVVSDGAWFLLYHADGMFWNDIDIITAAVEHNPAILELAGEIPRDDRGVVDAALAEDPSVFEHISERLRGDKTLVSATVSRCGRMLRYASMWLRRDAAVVLSAVNNDGLALEYAHHPTLTSSPDVVLSAVKNDGLALQHAHPTMRDDKAIIMAAIKSNPEALEFASGRLQNTIDVVETAVRTERARMICSSHCVERYIGKAVLGSVELFVRVPSLVRLASDDVLGDRSLFEQILPTTPRAWRYASCALKEDVDLALLVLRSGGWDPHCNGLESVCDAIPEKIFADKDVMLPIVGSCGYALRRCSVALKADLDMATAAVRNRRSSIAFVSDEIVLAVLVSVKGVSERGLKDWLGKRRGLSVWQAYLATCPDEFKNSIQEEQRALAARARRKRRRK